MKDFFISYNSNDKAWAEWIAFQLEEAGYTTVIQAWDFRPGADFVMEMQKAATGTRRTIAVLSDNYLNAEYTQPEWGNAFARDPKGEKRTLLPVRIAKCRPDGLLASRIYVDLVGLSEEDGKQTLLAALAQRAKPATSPQFPGSAESTESKSSESESLDSSTLSKQSFPGAESKALGVWREKLEFLQAQEPLITSPDQKFAIRKQIEEAEKRIEDYSMFSAGHGSAIRSASPELHSAPEQIVVSFILKEPSEKSAQATIAALKQLGFEQCTGGKATVSARLPYRKFPKIFGAEAKFVGASPPERGTLGRQAGFHCDVDLPIPPELEELVTMVSVTPPMDRISQ